MKKSKQSTSRTIEPVQNPSASGKAKRLPKKPLEGDSHTYWPGKSKFHN
jgi:hypothetical protein